MAHKNQSAQGGEHEKVLTCEVVTPQVCVLSCTGTSDHHPCPFPSHLALLRLWLSAAHNPTSEPLPQSIDPAPCHVKPINRLAMLLPHHLNYL